jgi:uracil phosphoribosyltransferase
MTVRVLDDAATGLHLARLRDVETGPEAFQRHAHVIGSLLAASAVQAMPTMQGSVQTPLGPAPTREPATDVVVVPVLRAGLGLLPGVRAILPTARVGMIGLRRDHDTHEPEEYYRQVPDVAGSWVFLLEPMLATGGSAAAAAAALLRDGPARVTVLSVVATQQAIDRIIDVSDDVDVVTAAVDPILNDDAYIVPGLGDFGDRLFGTL